MKRMTIGQLVQTVNEPIYIRSLYDISVEAELTNELRVFTGLLAIEVITMSYEEGFIVYVDVPASVIEGMKEA